MSQATSFRETALLEPRPDRSAIALRACCINEYLDLDGAASPALRFAGPLIPGVIYRAYTGIGLSVKAGELSAEATAESWAFGLQVVRIDTHKSGELLVYFTVLVRTDFKPDVAMFELRRRALLTSQPYDVTPSDVQASSHSLQLSSSPGRTIGAMPQTPKAAAKPATPSLNAWLATDTVGKAVEEPVGEIAPVVIKTLADF